ncbi:MAG TPA: glucose-6-phosphate isomerase [Rubricoccaceae bacterium]|nr:glucose-6-phosphate isomerase [Rubricoccaceae bacterium]
MFTLDRRHALPFLDPDLRDALTPRVEAAHQAVLDGTGAGAEMLGWRQMLLDPDDALLGRVVEVAEEVRARADVLLCIGIGGSYLGTDAVIDALSPPFAKTKPEVLFAGHHLSPRYHEELLHYLEGKSVYVNVISKSGTTLEPALAFRFVRAWMEQRFEDHARRTIATTDASKGVLHDLAAAKGYRTFVVPDDVGGRFSVLTPVGLLPIAAAGIDVRALVDGAGQAAHALTDFDPAHPAIAYAADRFCFHEDGYKTEVMAVTEPRLRGVGAWWQQLFGESEGKEHKGLFPVVLQYTTDLHSVGQYVQEGQRTLVETFLRVEDDGPGLVVEASSDDPDRLNYLAGKPYAEVNRVAWEATAAAHAEGGVPNWTVELPRLDAPTLGGCLYGFEHAVAVSGYLLAVNPFDQPGVEAYKQKMFALLGKP